MFFRDCNEGKIYSMENFDKLIRELAAMKDEVQWLEFKHNNYDAGMIGEDISALANGATLQDKESAYFIWGIDNNTHEIIGTKYDLQNLKKGNQELENWLRCKLSAHADFEYHLVPMDGVNVGLMIIKAATGLPVTFEKQEFIRIGSYTKKLKDFPAVMERLWNKLQNKKFEEQVALKDQSLDDVLNKLKYEVYFDRLNIPRPHSPEEILHYLADDGIIIKQDNGLYGITNLGAILFAKKLSDFPRVSRKALRVVQYADKSRAERLRENPEEISGYAVEFDEIMNYINALVPAKEVIENGIRKEKTAYPPIAIREAVANALIHQDMSITGAGPTVEIFSDRIEITNPGRSLVDVLRIVDTPPKSRNEKLSSLMRRMRICEELGTGWDKIVINCELLQLPAPKMEIYEESTRVLLFSKVDFSDMSLEERLWGCYLHACVKYIQGDYLTNSSLRERFGMDKTSPGTISRTIKEAVAKKLIRPYDPDTAPRYMKYVPIWG